MADFEARGEPRLAVDVVYSPSVLVREHFVGLVQAVEVPGGSLAQRGGGLLVGVRHLREPSVRALDVILGGVALDVQRRVEVAPGARLGFVVVIIIAGEVAVLHGDSRRHAPWQWPRCPTVPNYVWGKAALARFPTVRFFSGRHSRPRHCAQLSKWCWPGVNSRTIRAMRTRSSRSSDRYVTDRFVDHSYVPDPTRTFHDLFNDPPNR